MDGIETIGHNVIHGERRSNDVVHDDVVALLRDHGVDTLALDDLVGGNGLLSSNGLDALAHHNIGGTGQRQLGNTASTSGQQMLRGELDVGALLGDDVLEVSDDGVLAVGHSHHVGEAKVLVLDGVDLDGVTHDDVRDGLGLTRGHADHFGTSKAGAGAGRGSSGVAS